MYSLTWVLLVWGQDLHEAEAREEQEVVLGQELEAVGAEKSVRGVRVVWNLQKLGYLIFHSIN